MPSDVIRCGIPTAALLVSLFSPAVTAAPLQGDAKTKTAQAKSQDKPDVAELNRLLEEIRKLIESQVQPAQVVQRLKARTAQYKTIKGKVEDLPKPAPVTQATANVPPKPTKARLLGDDEKSDLADGTVMTIDGAELMEAEIKDLAQYLAGFQGGKVEDHYTTALDELIVIRALEAKFKDRVPKIKKEIESVLERAQAGEDFAALAKKHSDGPSKVQGGDLGTFGRIGMVPSFARHAFSLAPGKVSPVFASPFGYHIIKVTERNKGEKPAADQVRASHILKAFAPDPNSMRGLIQNIKAGNVKIAVVDDDWRNRLPQAYK